MKAYEMSTSRLQRQGVLCYKNRLNYKTAEFLTLDSLGGIFGVVKKYCRNITNLVKRASKLLKIDATSGAFLLVFWSRRSRNSLPVPPCVRKL